MRLEEDLQRQLDRPRIVQELGLRLVEARALRQQYVNLRAGVSDGLDVVYKSSKMRLTPAVTHNKKLFVVIWMQSKFQR
jgi:hypothetical protein